MCAEERLSAWNCGRRRPGQRCRFRFPSSISLCVLRFWFAGGEGGGDVRTLLRGALDLEGEGGEGRRYQTSQSQPNLISSSSVGDGAGQSSVGWGGEDDGGGRGGGDGLSNLSLPT